MAIDDYTLGEEARIQTGKTGDSPSNTELRALITRAKAEIEGETGLSASTIDWYGDTNAERALFWLTCVFLVGDSDAESTGFSVGELSIDASSNSDSRGPTERYEQRYRAALTAIAGNETPGFAFGNVQRDDRTYDFGSGQSEGN